MEMTRIPLDRIEPDPNNPRKDFGDLKRTAAGFSVNPVNPHEPFQPIVVVPWEGGWRIVDGERRWRAMCAAGQIADCQAIVCGDLEEADIVVAMLATDDKRELTAAERDRGVQTMLELGVQPARVDKAAGLKRGTASKVARGIAACEGMEVRQQSLDVYLAMERFAGDPEMREFIAGYEGASLESAIEREQTRRACAGALAAMEEACAHQGASIARRAPRRAVLAATLRPGRDPMAAVPELRRALRENPGATVVLPEEARDLTWKGVEVYAAPDPSAPDAGSDNHVRRAHLACQRRRAEWVSQRLLDDGWEAALPNTAALCRYWASSGAAAPYAAEFFRRAGIEAPEGFGGACPFSVAMAWSALDGMSGVDAAAVASWAAGCRFDDRTRDQARDMAAGFLAVMRVLRSDGYAPESDEEALEAAARALAGGEDS